MFRVAVLIALLAGTSAVATSQSATAQFPPANVTVSDTRAAGGLSLTVFTASTLGSTTTPAVLMGVEVFGLAEGARAQPGAPRQLEVDFRVDTVGASPASRVIVPLTNVEAVKRATEQGVRVFTRMSLGAGQYTLRVTVRDTGDRRTASAVHDLEVPNLLVGSLTMGDLVLSASGVDGVTHSKPDEDALLPLVGQPPTGRRQFSQSEKVEVDAEIYEAPSDDGFGGQLSITTSLLTPEGRVVYEAVDNGSSETLPSGVFGYHHYTLVPIATVPPGPYVIRVSVWVDGDGGGSTWRAVPITIVEKVKTEN